MGPSESHFDDVLRKAAVCFVAVFACGLLLLAFPGPIMFVVCFFLATLLMHLITSDPRDAIAWFSFCFIWALVIGGVLYHFLTTPTV
jgi:apolipoprotein N-acyltransferase